MRILLFNQNPVVEKLVTLSAKKSSDDVINIRSIDELIEEEVDLLLIDDDAFIMEENCYDAIREKIKFKRSCLIASRDADPRDDFDDVLYKPFLPTDLVIELERLKKDAEDVHFQREESPIDSLDLMDLDDSEENDEKENNDELNLDGLLDDSETESSEIDDALNNLDSDDEIAVDSELPEEKTEINSEFDDALSDLDSDDEVEMDSKLPEENSEFDDALNDLDSDDESLDNALAELYSPDDESLDNALAELDSPDDEFANPDTDSLEDDLEGALAELDAVENELNSFLETANLDEEETPKEEVLEETKVEKIAEAPKEEVPEESKVEEIAETPKEEVLEEIKVEEIVETPKEEVPEETKVEKIAEAPKEEILEKNSLDSISESEVAETLGEEIPAIIPVPIPVSGFENEEKKEEVKAENKSDEARTDNTNLSETIALLLQHLGNGSLKKALDGIEMNIKISFKDTTNE